MSNDNSTPKSEPQPPVQFATFLQAMPPSDQLTLVSDVLAKDHRGSLMITTPPIVLHCANCAGSRVYRYTKGYTYLGSDDPTTTFITYQCSNCRKEGKIFSLCVKNNGQEPAALCSKFGEIPNFGAPTPNRLLRLFGSDARIFLKGRQCENHGLGIGAFSYYRRVVESHKDQLFNEIIKVAAKIAPDTVNTLEQAKKQHQFLDALEKVKEIFPQGLLIDGHNPLTLLHRALSDGLHARSDEECLRLAHDIRVVLAALVERMGQALKNESELSTAIARLTEKRADEVEAE